MLGADGIQKGVLIALRSIEGGFSLIEQVFGAWPGLVRTLTQRQHLLSLPQVTLLLAS